MCNLFNLEQYLPITLKNSLVKDLFDSKKSVSRFIKDLKCSESLELSN